VQFCATAAFGPYDTRTSGERSPNDRNNGFESRQPLISWTPCMMFRVQFCATAAFGPYGARTSGERSPNDRNNGCESRQPLLRARRTVHCPAASPARLGSLEPGS